MPTDDQITPAWRSLVRRIAERTPARLFMGRAGSSYRTDFQLALRQAHAAAVDAVHHEFNFGTTLGDDFCQRWNLFEVQTLANSKAEFLLRPDRGRQLRAEAKQMIAQRCRKDPDVQILIGDGLSVSALTAQVPQLLPLLLEGAQTRGWSVGQPFAVRYCRVGVLNDIGELLTPRVAILLIGERPGLATAESLSAYMAFRPRSGHTDADRNLISNIHIRGTPPEIAAERILTLAAAMMAQKLSGTRLMTSGILP